MNFRLQDNTYVTVKEISKGYFDFELSFANGTKKTFRWHTDTSSVFTDRKGNEDALIKESIEAFVKNYSEYD